VFVRGRVLFDRSTLASNEADGSGGGLYANEGAVWLAASSRVERNRAEDGGGMTVSGDVSASVSGSSTVTANRADGFGGGVLVMGSGTLVVIGTFCMVLGNEADADDDGVGGGGGVWLDRGEAEYASPAERVCLNNPDDIAGT
jgi:hypothetical protein